ncbi:MAG: hypothetical protein VKP70_01720 [Cyanobacteriota bacterium]|nr:hypothetical protein [Cyanobacteriota bacterium]
MTILWKRGPGGRGLARRRAWCLLTLTMVGLTIPAARAESRTAESIWSQSAAQQEAINQVPLDDRDTITQTRCQEVGVGRMGGLPRYRCTVWFTPSAAPSTP